MRNDRIIVVGVPRCRPTENGTQMDIETHDGSRIELAMTPEAFRQWADECACPDKLASAVQLAPSSAEFIKCASGSDHVLMTLSVGDGGHTEFLLSHGDAVLLSVNLLKAAKDARNQPPQG